MQRIRVDEDIRSMSEFRTGISSFIQQVHETRRPLVITQHGKGVAVLVDAGEFEAMQERLELLEEVQTSTSQIDSGNSIDNETAKSLIMKRLE